MLNFKQYITEGRRWYHGTKTKNWVKIKKSRYIKPLEADNHQVAVHFTTDKKQAKEYAGKGGTVVSIAHKDLKQFKHKIYSSLPRGFRKKYGITKKEVPYEADAHVYEKIPSKHLKQEE